MTEEFNIFKNLDELRKVNLLDQVKSLESAKSDDINDSLSLDNDDFDFESLVNNNTVKKSPSKRQGPKEKTVKPEKKSKKNAKSRRSSTSTDGSISPTLPLFNNLYKEAEEMPVSRRTRRSLDIYKKIAETDTILKDTQPNSSKGRGRGKGSGRGRGRGRGRANTDVQNNSSDFTESSRGISTCTSLNVQDGSDNMSSLVEHFLQHCRSGRSRVRRSRRQCVAELAARSTQVDFIDLVSSPLVRVEGFIDLDSDTEKTTRTTRSKKKNQETFTVNSNKNKASTNASLDMSFDEDNPELNIKVNWKGKTEAFKMRKYQKFSIIFEKLAERENISSENMVFNLNDRIIMADDTPDSINYKIFQFIDGRVLSNHFNSPRTVSAVTKRRDANKITLKIQSDKWKRPLQIDIMKTDKLRILYIKCAEELKVGLDQLKLSFDGELLELNDTPADLELEGGEAIDLRIKN